MSNVDGVLEIKNRMVMRGKTIRVLRIIKNKTLQDVVRDTGLSISTLSAMENETRNVTSFSQLKLARYLLNDLQYTPDEVVVLQAFINQKEEGECIA